MDRLDGHGRETGLAQRRMPCRNAARGQEDARCVAGPALIVKLAHIFPGACIRLPLIRQLSHHIIWINTHVDGVWMYRVLILLMPALLILAVSVAIATDAGDGNTLVDEADELHSGARSGEDLRRAALKLEDALREFEKLSDKRGMSRTANNLGVIHKKLGNYERALRYLKISEDLCQQIGDTECQAQSLNNLALAYSDLGFQKEALQASRRSLDIRKRIRDNYGEALSLHGLGYVHYNLGNYPESLKWFELALERFVSLQQERDAGIVLNDIGDVQTRLGRYNDALESLELSRQTLQGAGNLREEAAVVLNLGVARQSIGRFEEAERDYLEAIELTRKMADPLGQGECLISLGNISRQLEKHDESLRYYKECILLFSSMGIPANRPNDLVGALLLDLNRVEEARTFIIAGDNKVSLARFYLINREYEKALNLYQSQSPDIVRNNDAEELFQVCVGIATIMEITGDLAGAGHFYKKAIVATEAIRASLKPEQRSNFFDVKVNGWLRTHPYEGYARVLIKMNREEEAFTQSEYTKARVFAENMSKRSRGFEKDVPLNIRRKDEELEDRLFSLLTKRNEARERGHDDVVKTLETQLKMVNKELESHIRHLRRNYPLFASVRHPQPMSLAQADLREGEWALVYDVTDQGLLVYLICGRKIIETRLTPCKRMELENLVRAFREPLEFRPCEENPDPVRKLESFDFNSGKRLADLLLGSLIAHIPKGANIIIIPDECLGLIPFEMLPLNNSGEIVERKGFPVVVNADFFGARNQIRYHHSVTALTMSRNTRNQPGANQRCLVIADPVYTSDDERTPKPHLGEKVKRSLSGLAADLVKKAWLNVMGDCEFTRLRNTGELAAKIELMFEGQTDSYIGLQATKENFLTKIAPSLERYDKIIFATHGYFGKNLPGIMEPTLVLSLAPLGSEGFLTMSEIMGAVRTNARIVALTACQTGLGRHVSGEGVLGLGRAFQYGGAKSLLVSLWSVDENASVEFVRHFFENIHNGANQTDALKSAREHIRQNGYDHPFFWAAFILVGDAD